MATFGARIVGVLVHMAPSSAGSVLEPVALLVERDGRPCPVSLDFEHDGAQSMLAGRIARLCKRQAAPMTAAAPLAHQRALDAVLAQLERKAMTGHLHLADGDGALADLRGTLLALGFDVIAILLDRYLGAPTSPGHCRSLTRSMFARISTSARETTAR